jgi:hypothetical protein
VVTPIMMINAMASRVVGAALSVPSNHIQNRHAAHDE